jgi:hypothetical protein
MRRISRGMRRRGEAGSPSSLGSVGAVVDIAIFLIGGVFALFLPPSQCQTLSALPILI